MLEVYKEFHLSDKDFNYLRKLVGERTGINLSPAKRQMVYGRLSRRLRELDLKSFSQYCELLKNGDEKELLEFTNAITTNLTSFFRELHHFEFLRQTLLPELLKNKSERRLRIWSAGCSSGEEPYSIAMVVREVIPPIRGWDVRILATDLDSNMLKQGKEGVYSAAEHMNGMPKERIKRFILKGHGHNKEFIKVSPELQEIIIFKQLNLMHDWPMRGPFDFIFCRNVVIYFSKDTQKDTQKVLFDRFADLLETNGHLFIGHSESLYNVSHRFQSLGRTIYRKNM